MGPAVVRRGKCVADSVDRSESCSIYCVLFYEPPGPDCTAVFGMMKNPEISLSFLFFSSLRFSVMSD